MKRRFVILDRDGTLIYERRYLSDPYQVELLPGIGNSLRKLRELGMGLIVVTNQSAVGRKYITSTRLDEIHARLKDLLLIENITLDGIYVCPHVPEDLCAC